jgi:7,8-dihydroneopterin aldolase/epimerase/oxygenase
MGKIVIAGLRELGVHGALQEEQARPQPFEVDVELDVDLGEAGESDRLDDTVDYSAVSEAVSRVVRSEQYHLLERLATRIAEVCGADPRVTAATVTVRKSSPAATPDTSRTRHVSSGASADAGSVCPCALLTSGGLEFLGVKLSVFSPELHQIN